MKKNKISKIQRYALKKVAKALVRVGLYHRKNAVEYYRVMNQAMWKETGDAPADTKRFLAECQAKAFNEDFGL